ncbi:MAG: hypothetical protein ABIO55_09845 [Ginsengibacter sp.]
MKNYSEEELKYIVDGFFNRTLDKSLWTHDAHIITAIWHLMKFDKEDALCRLRSGIISYNLATGVENTVENGYHETMTIFWWKVINQFLAQRSGYSYRDNCIDFLNSYLAEKNFPLRFYSEQNLFSAMARSRFVNPDVQEIKI